MRVEIINQSKTRIPRTFIKKWLDEVEKKFMKSKVFTKGDHNKEITLVFLDSKAAKDVNMEFRQKNYPTDVLSFESFDADSLGELILCPDVLKAQAKEHGLTFQEELGYMILHGVLHLKGYDHEKSKKAAEKMFEIQDKTFTELLRKWRS